MSEMYRVCLNYEGKDITLDIDNFDAACLLINNPEAAQKYLKNHFETSAMDCDKETMQEKNFSSSSEIEPTTSTNPNLPSTSETFQTVASTSGADTPAEIVWTKKKPTSYDQAATFYLLELRKKFCEEFDDKKTNKLKIWAKVARAMKENNFLLGEGGGERCRQKFANICKPYLKYIKNQKTTGSEKIDVPPYFEEIHDILGTKDKITPRYLNDSVEDLQEGEGEEEEDMENQKRTEKRPLIEKIFESRKRLKPLGKSENILKQMEKDRDDRNKEFAVLQNHLQKTEEQRERLLNILERSLSKQPKSKKNRPVESDSDD